MTTQSSGMADFTVLNKLGRFINLYCCITS